MFKHDARQHRPRNRSARKSSGTGAWPPMTALAAVLVAGAFVPDARSDPTIPFAEAEIFFELNNTDGDLGIHALIDGDAWKQLEIMGPSDFRLLEVEGQANLEVQGLTEIFFESAEPPFDELSPAEFFFGSRKGFIGSLVQRSKISTWRARRK